MTTPRICAAALLVALVAALAPLSAGADAPTAIGWWWSGNIEGLPVQPPPPDVPEGGLYVASGLSGASGVSALRFVVPEGATEPVLTLRLANVSGTVVIGACPAATPWEPAEGGPFAARPEPDCERASVPAELSADGTTAQIPLGALVDGSALDIVILPGTDPMTGAGATFEASFEPPGSDAIAFAESSTGSEPPPTTAPPASATSPTSFTAPATATPAAPFAAPTPPAQPSPVAFVPAANSSPAAQDPAAVSTPGVDGAATVAATTPSDADGRIVGLVLGAMVVGAWLVLTRTAVGERLAASSGGSGDTVRGIGRFAAPRDAKAPTL